MTNLASIGPHALDWDAGHLSGWTYRGETKTWFQGTFRNQHTVSRECPVCNAEIKINVTAKALTGHATNHGLMLRRCKKCREALKTGGVAYEVRKRLGEAVERAPEGAAPAVTGFAKPAPEIAEELERLREWEVVWFRALKTVQTGCPDASMLNIDRAIVGMLEASTKIFAELQPLKARLAKYELQPAMEAAAPSTEEILAAAKARLPKEVLPERPVQVVMIPSAFTSPSAPAAGRGFSKAPAFDSKAAIASSPVPIEGYPKDMTAMQNKLPWQS